MDKIQNQEKSVDKTAEEKIELERTKILSLKLADIFKELQYKDSLIERVATCG